MTVVDLGAGGAETEEIVEAVAEAVEPAAEAVEAAAEAVEAAAEAVEAAAETPAVVAAEAAPVDALLDLTERLTRCEERQNDYVTREEVGYIAEGKVWEIADALTEQVAEEVAPVTDTELTVVEPDIKPTKSESWWRKIY